MENFIIINNYPFKKGLLCSIIIKELHLLYFFFSNYPFLYGILTDGEINQIFTKFKPNMNKNQLQLILDCAFSSINNIAGFLAMKVDKGESILEEKEYLKIFHISLIEFSCSCDQLYHELDIEKLNKYYQIKNYIRDINFCLCIFLISIYYRK